MTDIRRTVGVVVEIGWARSEAERLVAPLGSRWAHTVAVAEQAERLRSGFVAADADRLVAAAYLHDVGYARGLCRTGFHPLDGAAWLAGRVEPEIVALVAHHSCARIEADLRGLAKELDALPSPDADLLDALTYCDMTSGPDGERVTVADRLSEVTRRYGPGHVVTRSIEVAADSLRDAATRAERRYQAALVGQPR